MSSVVLLPYRPDRPPSSALHSPRQSMATDRSHISHTRGRFGEGPQAAWEVRVTARPVRHRRRDEEERPARMSSLPGARCRRLSPAAPVFATGAPPPPRPEHAEVEGRAIAESANAGFVAIPRIAPPARAPRPWGARGLISTAKLANGLDSLKPETSGNPGQILHAAQAPGGGGGGRRRRTLGRATRNARHRLVVRPPRSAARRSRRTSGGRGRNPPGSSCRRARRTRWRRSR